MDSSNFSSATLISSSGTDKKIKRKEILEHWLKELGKCGGVQINNQFCFINHIIMECALNSGMSSLDLAVGGAIKSKQGIIKLSTQDI